ncbi:MFS transporter [Mycolicibacterium aichiense]|uniref:MFS transporter n=1 Tax=Mycolicibacterium aichiense TaxID=1799 RepID=UPI003D66A790
MSVEPTTLNEADGTKGHFSTLLRSRQFIGPIIAIGGVQLMAAMDGPVAVFALPKIQNELGLSDAARSWVVTAYMLTFGGLVLLGGRLGDAIGRKRAFILGIGLFIAASAMCGIAWNGGSLVVARLLHGVAGAVVAPTCMALVATTFPRGPARNVATAVFGATASVGSVMGLVLGGLLTGVSWRLAFLINVPIGLLLIYLARTMLQETQKERMKLDAAGAVLATLLCTAAVFGLSMAPEHGWASPATIGLGGVVLLAFIAFIVVERGAENPIVPLSLFFDRSRLATFAAMFLLTGVGFSLTVTVAMYVQDIMGYSPFRAGIAYIPLAVAMAVGVAVSTRFVTWFAPRLIVLVGAALVLGSMIYGGLTINPHMPYFPNLVIPIVIGSIGIGLINVPLGLSLIASVGPDRIGPASAIAVMLQSLGGPLVLVFIQVVITTRTLQLGGTTGPAAGMSPAQLTALDHGYTYGLLWIGGVVVLLAVAALFMGYTSRQVAHAQKVQKTLGLDGAPERP